MIKPVFIFLLLISTAIAQVGLINDKDGYTNVRENPDIKSKVIYKIKDYELFLFYDYDTNESDNWIKVYIPKNKYALAYEGLAGLTGYIHKSRLLSLDNLEKFDGKNFRFKYHLRTFSVDNKIIDYIDGKWISRINGRPFYGTAGSIPNNEISSIEVRVGEKTIHVPEVLYQDLFELTNDFNIYKKDNIFYVQQWNSDGGGGYLLVWAIDKNSIRQRLIMIP